MNIGEEKREQADRAKPTILIVEDEPDIRDSFAVILEDKYNLTMAESAEEALERLRGQTDVRMIFLDYQLPGMTGLDFLKAMHQYSIRVPVVMVTGRGTRDIAAEAFQYEAQDYITKPFRVKDIEDTVVRILKGSAEKKTPLARAKQLIDRNISGALSTQDIASTSGTRYRHLVDQFKEETGKTIVGFKNERRIELAKKYLREKDWSIEDIGIAVGFKRQNYFSYVFHKIVGLSPTDYRKQFR